MPRHQDPDWIRVLLPTLVVAIVIVDVWTPLGYAVWVLHLAPLVLSVFGKTPSTPLRVAAASTLAIMAVPWVSPPGVDAMPVAFSRGLAIVAMWGIAGVLRQSIIGRNVIEREEALRAGTSHVLDALQGDFALEEFGHKLLEAVGAVVGAQAGVVYIVDDHSHYRRVAVTGLAREEDVPASLGVGSTSDGARMARAGLQLLTDIPPGFLSIQTPLGRAEAGTAVVFPLQLSAAGAPVGLVELARVDHEPVDLDLLALLSGPLARGLRAADDQGRRDALLEETQRQSEELQQQQEELRVTNEELETQTAELEESQAQLEEQATALESVNARLRDQAEALHSAKLDAEQASRQKSAFLSNVSHELRTPLNSILLLASLESEGDGHEQVTPDQRRRGQAIHAAGRDLLALIDDLLDLSRIEAGRFEIVAKPESMATMLSATREMFAPVARDRGVGFEVVVSPSTPAELTTDARRLRQVLRNLLSNAFKFTDAGTVRLQVGPAQHGGVSFTVHDTGPGIPADEQERVFEPFLQLDGTVQRRYGGTGLGLTIARDLAHRLGGTLTLESTVGSGTSFTLTVPDRIGSGTALSPTPAPVPAPVAAPPTAPVATGGPVVRAARSEARTRRLLLFDAGDELQRVVTQQFSSHGVEVVGLSDPQTVLDHLDGGAWDALVVGSDMEPRAVQDLVRTIAADERFAFPPIIVHTRGAMPRSERERLVPYVRSIVRDDGASRDRILDEIMLALSASERATPPADEGRARAPAHNREAAFEDRVILVAEDDERNVNALRQVFEPRGARLVVARNGREALDLLDAGERVDLVLMDIMMPEMDGYTAMREIRKRPALAKLPIIALTAKAMIDDRNRCLAAGANDYISKPVDLEKLLALCRIWTPR